MFYRVVSMDNELVTSRSAARPGIRVAAAIYTVLFRLARRAAIEPAPDSGPAPFAASESIAFLMAVDAARHTAWLR